VGVREKLNQLKPLHVGIAASICIALAAYVVYTRLSGSQPGKLGGAAVLQCIHPQCAHVAHTTLGDVLEQTTVDGMDRRYPAMPCPKCGQNALALAIECPNCKTVFHRLPQAPPPDGAPQQVGLPNCPKCGQSMIEWEREQMRKGLE